MKQFFKNIWEKWKVIAQIIGKFNTKVIISLVYFLIISPLGAVFRLFGWNPLGKFSNSKPQTSNWKTVKDSEPDKKSMSRQS